MSLQLQKVSNKERFKEEVFKLLPSSISGIKVQKKNQSRYSIFIDDQFLVGVSDSTLTQFNLNKGVLITPLLFHEVVQKEDAWAIKEYLIRLLGRRDHAKSELKLKAIKKGFSAPNIDPILEELVLKKYINDANFALKYAHDKFKFSKWGVVKIKVELRKKGISDRDIETATQQVPDKDVEETITLLVLKNKPKFLRTEQLKRKKKVFDFLLRKGYDSNILLKQLPTLVELIEK